MNPEQNPGPKLSVILTQCTEPALDGARTGRNPVPSINPTVQRKR